MACTDCEIYNNVSHITHECPVPRMKFKIMFLHISHEWLVARMNFSMMFNIVATNGLCCV